MLGQQVGVLSHAIAGALDLDDHSVVKKAVEQRGGHHRIAKDITPFGEAAVGALPPRLRSLRPLPKKILAAVAPASSGARFVSSHVPTPATVAWATGESERNHRVIESSRRARS